MNDVKAQTSQIMKNIDAVLKAAGSGPERVVKTTVLLARIEDWPEVNKVYAQCSSSLVYMSYSGRLSYGSSSQSSLCSQGIANGCTRRD